MTNSEILSHIDHTLLKAYSSWEDIKLLCDDAVKYATASVCVPQSYVKRIANEYPSLNICTVIGFPLGYSTTEVKVFEAEQSIKDGANEIDMVINIGDVKNGDFSIVTDEIAKVKKACKDKILKVIIETCYLDEKEKIKLCRCVSDAKADFIKTSTGFGSGGATIADVKLFLENLDDGVKIKAAGGISDIDEIKEFLDLGCERIGTSRAVKMLKNE